MELIQAFHYKLIALGVYYRKTKCEIVQGITSRVPRQSHHKAKAFLFFFFFPFLVFLLKPSAPHGTLMSKYFVAFIAVPLCLPAHPALPWLSLFSFTLVYAAILLQRETVSSGTALFLFH